MHTALTFERIYLFRNEDVLLLEIMYLVFLACQVKVIAASVSPGKRVICCAHVTSFECSLTRPVDSIITTVK